jgi:transcriptional regulator with XRE-family HTH domain
MEEFGPFDPQRYADSRRDRDGGAPQVTRLDGRNGAIWRQYTIYRRTQEEIAEEFGISQTSVSQIIAEIRAGIPKHDLDAMRQESLELYRELTRRALEIVDLVPAPVYVGKDGAIAYDDQGKVVRDYSGRLRAIETAAKMEDHTRKLMGLDAATKQEVSGSVKYEMIGIDESDLT